MKARTCLIGALLGMSTFAHADEPLACVATFSGDATIKSRGMVGAPKFAQDLFEGDRVTVKSGKVVVLLYRTRSRVTLGAKSDSVLKESGFVSKTKVKPQAAAVSYVIHSSRATAKGAVHARARESAVSIIGPIGGVRVAPTEIRVLATRPVTEVSIEVRKMPGIPGHWITGEGETLVDIPAKLEGDSIAIPKVDWKADVPYLVIVKYKDQDEKASVSLGFRILTEGEVSDVAAAEDATKNLADVVTLSSLALVYFRTELYGDALALGRRILAAEPSNAAAVQLVSLCEGTIKRGGPDYGFREGR